MIWLTPFVGAILLLTLVGDVYATVFVPRGPVGPLSRRLYAAFWAGWNRFGDHLPPDRRRHGLALIGPLLVPLTVMVWGSFLVMGYALFYYPWAGTLLVVSDPRVRQLLELARSVIADNAAAILSCTRI